MIATRQTSIPARTFASRHRPLPWRNRAEKPRRRWNSYTDIDNVAGTASASGYLVEAFNTDAFGNTLASTQTGEWAGGLGGNRGLTTKELDPAAGLYYFSQRLYDPQTATFASRAPYPPMREHPYGYVENDPVLWVDPFGSHRVWILVTDDDVEWRRWTFWAHWSWVTGDATDIVCRARTFGEFNEILHEVHERYEQVTELFVKGHGGEGAISISPADGSETSFWGEDVGAVSGDCGGINRDTTVWMYVCNVASTASVTKKKHKHQQGRRGSWGDRDGPQWSTAFGGATVMGNTGRVTDRLHHGRGFWLPSQVKP